MSKKLVLIIVVVLLVGVFVFWRNSKEKIVSYEFVGQVSKVENDRILVDGVYVVEGRPDLSGPDKKRTVAVILGGQTKFVKKLLYLPTAEEVEATGGRFEPDKLKQEKVLGTLDDLKKEGVSIRGIASQNVYNRNKFTAVEILYIEPIYP